MQLTSLFQHRYFRNYALGSATSLIGTWAQRVAIGWMVWEITGSAAWLGILALADAAPVALLALLGGALSDQHTPLRLARGTVAAGAICTMLLGLVALAEDPALPALILLIAANGVASALGQPARMVLAASLVPERVVPAAVACGSLTFNLARVIGPLAGGALIAVAGASAAIGFNALTYVLFLVVLLRLPANAGSINAPGGPRRSAKAHSAKRTTLIQLLRVPGLGSALLITIIVAITVRGYVELLPGIVDTLFGHGPQALALITSCAGLGAIVGGLSMLREQDGTRLRLRMHWSSVGAALALLGLAGSNHLVLAMFAVALAGLTLVISATAAQSIIQLNALTGTTGRCIGLYLAALRAGPALGALCIGTLAGFIELRSALILGSTLGLIGSLWVAGYAARARVASPAAPHARSTA